MQSIKHCPFCGGNAKVSFKDYKYGGKNFNGDEKISYRVQVMCNKCKARGKPIITPMLINPNPYRSQYYLSNLKNSCASLYNCGRKEDDEMFMPYIEQAISAWNTRKERENNG